MVQSLKDSVYLSHLTGFSDTSDVTLHPIVIRDKHSNRYYHINLIDAIGLNEHSHDPANNRSDEDILNLTVKLIHHEMTTLNAVIFDSTAGDRHLNGIATFQSLMTLLGPSFENNTMLVLTHVEGLTRDRFEALAGSIRNHPLSKEP